MQAEHLIRLPGGSNRQTKRRAGLAAVTSCLVVLGLPTAAPAFQDREFCVVAQQFAAAAEKDIGVWIDRTTRSAGMTVLCDKKTVEFTRFTYAPSASLDQAWKERNTARWSSVQCASAVWSEAIRNGWKIVLSQNSADGGKVLIAAHCKAGR
jgi:hypothetical protein